MENKIENNDKTTRNYPTEEDSLKDAFSAWAPRYKVIGGNLCMEMNSKQGKSRAITTGGSVTLHPVY